MAPYPFKKYPLCPAILDPLFGSYPSIIAKISWWWHFPNVELTLISDGVPQVLSVLLSSSVFEIGTLGCIKLPILLTNFVTLSIV